MKYPARRHLDEVGESYATHFGVAFGLGMRLIGAGLACMVHGLFPSLFTHAASDGIMRLHKDLAARRGHDNHWVI